MVTKEYICSYLRVNGIREDLSPELLRNELGRIGWAENDIADALCVLRGDIPATDTIKINKMLYSDATLPADAVVSLLNVRVQHKPRTREGSAGMSNPVSGSTHTLAALAVAVIVASITFVAVLLTKTGAFNG